MVMMLSERFVEGVAEKGRGAVMQSGHGAQRDPLCLRPVFFENEASILAEAANDLFCHTEL